MALQQGTLSIKLHFLPQCYQGAKLVLEKIFPYADKYNNYYYNGI